MRYFHDEVAKAVWEIPAEPTVEERRETRTKKRKYPKRTGWFLSVIVERTRADNWIDPRTNQWFHRVAFIRKQYFDHPDDSREFVVGEFRAQHMHVPGVEISEPVYRQLKQEYEAIARENSPPNPLPPRQRRI